MKKYLCLLIILSLLCGSDLYAGRRKGSGSHKKSSYSSTNKSKTVHVKSYTTKKGKTVKAHDRSAPKTRRK